MKIVLVGKKIIIKDTLPKGKDEIYWIRDNREEGYLFRVNRNNGNWELNSDDDVKIIRPSSIKIESEKIDYSLNSKNTIKNIELKQGEIYAVYIQKLEQIFILFCLPEYQKKFFQMDITNIREFTIGYDSNNNDIVYENALVADVHAKVSRRSGKWVIENYDKNFGLFVNDFPVFDNKKTIFNGDVIFIMGLKLIFIKNTIYITNPNDDVRINKNIFKESKIKNDISEIESLEKEKEVFLSDNNIKYFIKSPRIQNFIKKETIKIDEPPQINDDKQKPSILAIGSTVLFGVMSFAYITSTVKEIYSGELSIIEIIISILSSLAMIASMIILPIIEIKWEEKMTIKYESRRKEKYKEYLEKKKNQIEKIKQKQKEILNNNYLSIEECENIILKYNHRLWERNIEDFDFLSVKVGEGNAPLEVEISYPEEKFNIVEDTLLTKLNELLDSSKNINDAPISMSFFKNNISAIVSKNSEIIRKFMRNIILQLITFHSYADLKLVFFVDKNTSKDWEYVKYIPHIWDSTKQVRFFADNYNNMGEISKYLIEELKKREQEDEKGNNDNELKNKLPYYLIITDNYTNIESLDFFVEIKKKNKNFGFSLLCVSDSIYKVSDKCSCFLKINNYEEASLILYTEKTKEMDFVKLDEMKPIYYEKISKRLLNIPIREKSKAAFHLPQHYTFLEMYNVGKIEQLNIYDRWKKNDSTLSLRAPIGIDGSGMLVELDAHEKKHGPHGLIAGSTGSGKSEFIITYILSLAINYHPDDVSFLLIDYKGGGLAGAFQKKDIKLPHLVGTITNIDKNGLQRSLTSIQSELRRRQVEFNKARDMTDGGTIDIYKYQKLYHDGVVKNPIPHLFIICDEFAELKQQQEDFMEELMSVSRIGRSLGVHLILATQKPAGIVNDQIRSNSKFAICLKVQDTSDSSDVILTPDAAYLKNSGQFYMRVGQDEYYILGQSGWAGANYFPSNESLKSIDSSIEFIDDIGGKIKKVDDNKQKKVAKEGDQLTNILKNIYEIAEKENIRTGNLWLADIPEIIYVKELRKKYKLKKEENNIRIVYGEYDDPSNQKQGLVSIDLVKKDNVIIYGNAKSGKETLLSTIIYDTITEYSSEQVQIYIVDFGSEALKIFGKVPHVGDMVFMGEDEKFSRFLDMIKQEINDRKDILSNYGGDYNLYISKGNKMPYIMIVLNNYEAFEENYDDKYGDLMLMLTREALKCGLFFIVTASSTNSMRYRQTQNFNNKIALQLNDDDEFLNIFDNLGKKRPSHIFGRGLVKVEGEEPLEFQTAKICLAIDYNEHISQIIEELNKTNLIKARSLPSLPALLEVKDIVQNFKDINKIPIAMIVKNLNYYYYNFISHFFTIITGKNSNDIYLFAYNVFELLNKNNDINVMILDTEKTKNNLKKEYKSFISEIKKGISKNHKQTLCMVFGISKLIEQELLDEFEFNDLLEEAKESGKYTFIIIDVLKDIQDHTYDQWYENNISSGNGIWVGKGVEDQTIISSDFDSEGLENNCGQSFGYIIEDGNATFVKLLGIKEDGE